MAKPNWLTLGQTSGTGNSAAINVTAAAHTGRVSRSGKITGTTKNNVATNNAPVSQAAAAEFIAFKVSFNPNSVINVLATAQSKVLEGTSNSANLKIVEDTTKRISGVTYSLEVNNVADTSWNGTSDTGIDGDPGAAARYTWKLTVNIPENKTVVGRQHQITIANGNGNIHTLAVTFGQSAGVKTYANPVISSFVYTDVLANGTAGTPSVSYTQTWGWNGNTTNGGTLNSGATLSYSGASVNTATGAVTASSLETIVKARTKITDATVTVEMNGASSQKSVAVYQQANSATYGPVALSRPDFSNDAKTYIIPASGGTISEVAGLVGTQTVTYTSKATRAGAVTITYTDAITGSNLGMTVKSQTLLGTLVATGAGEGGKSATYELKVYQQANVATYGEIYINMSSPIALKPAGESYVLDPSVSQTIAYTSGASRDIYEPDIVCTYAVKHAATGFTLSAPNTVVVSANPTVNDRPADHATTTANCFIVTVNATGEDGKTASKDFAFYQQGAASVISFEPSSLSFAAAGETKTIKVKSTDSWTLS